MRVATRLSPKQRGDFLVEYRESEERRQDSGSIPQPHRWVRLGGPAGRCTEWSRAGTPLVKSERKNCGVMVRQAAETLAELPCPLALIMHRYIED